MKIAILMSTYNGERFLRQQIDSILNQSVECQMDLLIRDDGSTDSTRAILEEYAEEGKLQWYYGENLKPAKSFLHLLQHCPGYDYYVFADQDDYWYSNKVQQGINRIKEMRVPAISCANARLVNGMLQDLGRNVYNNLPHTDFYSITCSGGILGCTMVFNQALAKLIQDKPMPQNVIMHDYYLCVVCTLHDGVVLYDHEPCMKYRQHGNNVVGSSWKKTDAIKDRLQQIMNEPAVTLDKMAASICENYPDVPAQKLLWLKKVSQYRSSLRNAIQLMADRKPKFNSLNKEITIRTAILFRNR